MNLLLFPSEAQLRHIPAADPRLSHIRQILKAGAGQRIYVGLQNGHRAWATIVSDTPEDGLRLEPCWEPLPPPPPLPVSLLVGMPRPQTAKRVLFEAAVLGAQHLLFFQAQKGEPSYAQSSLWQEGKWQEHLLQGAEQACVTSVPEVHHFDSLKAALSHHLITATAASARIGLDVYEATVSLPQALSHAAANNGQPPAIALCIGAERGWADNERQTLREHGFTLAHLGARVLRTETAVISALTLCANAVCAYSAAHQDQR